MLTLVLTQQKLDFVQHTTTLFLDKRYFTDFDLVVSASGYLSRVAFLSTDSPFQWTTLYMVLYLRSSQSVSRHLKPCCLQAKLRHSSGPTQPALWSTYTHSARLHLSRIPLSDPQRLSRRARHSAFHVQ
jgi:hypothetical protein